MDKILRNLLIIILLFGIHGSTIIYAQKVKDETVTIKGKIVDENGQPVPNILVNSFYGKKAAISDIQGEFSLAVSKTRNDKIVVNNEGYNYLVDTIEVGVTSVSLTLEKKDIFNTDNVINLPYDDLTSGRIVGAVSVVTGSELESYPSDNILDALMGRIPGLSIDNSSYTPGQENSTASIRGAVATIYIDGVIRDVAGLTASEIDKVEVIKDLPGRSMLGITGSAPVLWITTKKGERYNNKISVSAEYGVSMPTTLPKYLDAFNYATLYNEALENDGFAPLYSASDLNAYKNQSDPVRYPDINYYNEYLKRSAPIARGNISFTGGDERVTYFSTFNFLSDEGLESMGEKINNDRVKLRSNVDIRLNDFMSLGVSIAGSYNKQRFPNTGAGTGVLNIFNTLSQYPANAHPIYFGDKLIVNDDYPLNLTNELMYSGFAQGQVLNAQNTANLFVDLGSILKGLSFNATASFDIMNQTIQNKGGTADLYRLETTTLGADTAVLITPAQNVVTLTLGDNSVARRTEMVSKLKYVIESGKHSLIADAVYYMGLNEIRTTSPSYQPTKTQDLSLRANYTYDNKYVVDLDLSYSGSMRMPVGDRFSLYPTAGLAWIASNENFLKDSKLVNYLKLFGSIGIIGVGDYGLTGYNPYYLYETLWTQNGTWRPGIPGNLGSVVNVYNILQIANPDISLPRKRYFNIGLQSEFFGKKLSLEVNYFNEYNYDKLSNRSGSIPSVIGVEFLPMVNFGEDVRWGFDGMAQYKGNAGDFSYSIGVNATYLRGKYLVVDEPAALEDYRKLAGTDMDLFRIYNAEGLYQSEQDILTRNVEQGWGAVQPGDIRYEDYNNDGLVDKSDIYATGQHSPRIFYGLNLSVGYKGFGLFVLGQGVADGDVMLSSSRYFRINSALQSYSELMLDRWPVTNNIPRLTTTSDNNTQNSTFWLRNAAYLKLKNVEISYTFRNKSQNTGLDSFKFFVRGTNLFSVSGLNQYNVDPENINAGITGYPVLKTYTVGFTSIF